MNNVQIEEHEFDQLVAEMRDQGFTRSKEVSSYIRQNKLGRKYKHISGILEMKSDERIWNFEGGFPPRIYARLCGALNLASEGTNARPTKFTPYSELD